MNGAAEAFADAVGDAALVAVEANQRRKQDKEKDRQSREDDIQQTTERATADGRRNISVDEFAWLEGWIHFLHERLSGAMAGRGGDSSII